MSVQVRPRQTYVVSFHEEDGHLLLEEVRTQRRVRLAELSDIGEQIRRWLEQGAADESAGPNGARIDGKA